MNTTTFQTGLVKCRCQHCNGHIEFDPVQLDQSRSNADITCPHCGLETLLYVPPVPLQLKQSPLPKGSNRNGNESEGWLMILIPIIIIAALILTAVFLVAADKSVTDLAAWFFGSILAIYWIIFPIFVCRLLKQIERNTRRD